MMRAWLFRAAGIFAGASIAAVLAALCGGAAVPFTALLLPITVGTWLVAAGLTVLMTLLSFSSRLRPRLGGTGLACGAGLGLGLVPVPLQLGLQAPLAYLAGAALALGITIAAWRRPPPLHPLLCAGLLVLVPIVAVAAGFRHDAQLRVSLNAEVEQRLILPELAAAEPAPPAGAPDVYLISIDTLRADALAGPRPAGYELPFLDSLRRSGLSWEYGLSSSNQTVPGHAGMLMGRDAAGTGVRWNHDSLPSTEADVLLAERFRAAGFRTAGVISNGLLSSAGGFNRGFEIYDDTTVAGRGAVAQPLEYVESSTWLGWLLDPRLVEAVLTETVYFSSTKPYRNQGKHGLLARGALTSDLALAALEQLYAQERAFFCFLHYMDPHSPYGSPPPYAGRLTKDLPPYAERYRPSARQGMFGIPEIDRAARDLRSEDAATRAEAELAIRWFHLTYLEKLMFMDAQIQRIHERAEASGRPTVWLVTSDHGEHFGEHGVVLHSNTLYEELVRVPFFLAGAGVPAQTAGRGIPRLEDVAPTLLGLAGITPPKELKGRILGSEDAAGPEIPHLATDNRRLAVREGEWKLHGVWEGLTEFKTSTLFRIATDAGEAHVLPTDTAPGSLLETLRTFLQRDYYPIRRDRGTPDAALRWQLEQLGYADNLVEQ